MTVHVKRKEKKTVTLTQQKDSFYISAAQECLQQIHTLLLSQPHSDTHWSTFSLYKRSLKGRFSVPLSLGISLKNTTINIFFYV